MKLNSIPAEQSTTIDAVSGNIIEYDVDYD